jgi:hypothetical protein
MTVSCLPVTSLEAVAKQAEISGMILKFKDQQPLTYLQVARFAVYECTGCHRSEECEDCEPYFATS